MIKFTVKELPQQIIDSDLIRIVKNHEFLFNTKNPDYRNLPQRSVVWGSIAKELGISDRKLEQNVLVLFIVYMEIYVSENVVQKRWKVLREKFSVAFRKYQTDGTLPTWSCYDSCMFLEPFVNVKPDLKKEEPELPLVIDRNPSKSPFDENMLTELVKERPVLYDKQHEDFRAGNMRKKAWVEIANITGWDVDLLQKRWRVMRDRFVRELRRTKNIDGDSQVNCSAFFRDMLFLVRHVKSKKYEAEATDVSSDMSQDNWEVSADNENGLQVETCVIPETEDTIEENQSVMEETTDSAGQVVTYSIDEGHQQHYVECFESREEVDQAEIFDESSNDVQGDDYYEDDVEVLEKSIEEEQHLIPQVEDVVAVQEIPHKQWFQTANLASDRKRRISYEVCEEPTPKRSSESPAPSISGQSRLRISDSTGTAADEDVAFGQTIGLMLKKIPLHRKTTVKLEIYESIARALVDEVEHKYMK